MAALRSTPFRSLFNRLIHEPQLQEELYGLPKPKWYAPDPGGPKLTTWYDTRRVGTPCGPAAGPHTQLAQNILLSYVAGGRMIELKTVQEKDRLEIGRPCIDVASAGFNIEWSQELRLEESLREYVAGAMLIEIFRHTHPLADKSLAGDAGAYVLDMSVGYDLAGIKGGAMQRFFDGMRNAEKVIDRLRAEIPTPFTAARNLEFPNQIAETATLSTFHGCPPEEIGEICSFLMAERELDVVVKLNPTTLGKESLEHLLHDVLGYTDMEVNPRAYESALALDDAVTLAKELCANGEKLGRRVGFKFTNTLEVRNTRERFPEGSEWAYLSGQPLHVIALSLADAFRQKVGPDLPLSFSGGVDKHNFAQTVACGFLPVTICSDLLRTGGYERLPEYLDALSSQMRQIEATSIDEFVMRRYGHEEAACKRAGDPGEPEFQRQVTRWAASMNLFVVANEVQEDERYRAPGDDQTPNQVDSELTTFDCLSCKKCLPVCPNAALFVYPATPTSQAATELVVQPNGTFTAAEAFSFDLTQREQVACYADACNACGNCEAYCVEIGAPHRDKPRVYANMDAWHAAAPEDGVVFGRHDTGAWVRARIDEQEYYLRHDASAETCRFSDGVVEVVIDANTYAPLAAHPLRAIDGEHRVDMRRYHELRILREGVFDAGMVNWVNATELV